MSERVPTKDRVSLDDLKLAIERYEAAKAGDDTWVAVEWQRYGEAWRTAFMWRDKDEWPRMSEYVNGMALIREKLR